MKDEEVPLWATTRDVAAARARRVERTTGDIWGSGVGGGRKERMWRRKETSLYWKQVIGIDEARPFFFFKSPLE